MYGRPHDSWVQVQVPPGIHYSLHRSLAIEGHEEAQFSATSGDFLVYVWANRETGARFDINDMSPQRWYKMLMRGKWITPWLDECDEHMDSDDEMNRLTYPEKFSHRQDDYRYDEFEYSE